MKTQGRGAAASVAASDKRAPVSDYRIPPAVCEIRTVWSFANIVPSESAEGAGVTP